MTYRDYSTSTFLKLLSTVQRHSHILFLRCNSPWLCLFASSLRVCLRKETLRALSACLSLPQFGALEEGILINKRKTSLTGGKTSGRLLSSRLRAQYSTTSLTLKTPKWKIGVKCLVQKLTSTRLNLFLLTQFQQWTQFQHNSFFVNLLTSIIALFWLD